MNLILKNHNYKYSKIKFNDEKIIGLISYSIDSLLRFNKLKIVNINKNKSCLYSYININDNFVTNIVYDEMLLAINKCYHKYKNNRKRLVKALEVVGLNEDYLSKKISTLTTSEKILIKIAISFLNNPSVYFFVDVFKFLDYNNKKILIRLFNELKKSYHKTIFLLSSDSDLLYEITDEILAINEDNYCYNKTIDILKNNTILDKFKITKPTLIEFTDLIHDKKIEFNYYNNVNDVIKEVYRHAKE